MWSLIAVNQTAACLTRRQYMDVIDCLHSSPQLRNIASIRARTTRKREFSSSSILSHNTSLLFIPPLFLLAIPSK